MVPVRPCKVPQTQRDIYRENIYEATLTDVHVTSNEQ
jgi:hypothetical protein